MYILVDTKTTEDLIKKVKTGKPSEITKMDGDIITMQDIFVYKHTGWDENGRMTGTYVPTGNIPNFMEDITRAKLDLSVDIFTPPQE